MTTGPSRRRTRSHALAAILTAVTITGCGKLDELQYAPATTPEQWQAARPSVDVGGTVLNEPLGTFLVFLLAGLWVAVGIMFLVTRRGQRSRLWLGIALVLGGLGAAQAGISYQAFSYVLKCEGRQYCLLTNGFEVGYSLTQAASVSAMLIAVAYACTRGGLRRGLIIYSIVNTAVYVVISLIGIYQPNATLLSFSVLMLFALPGIVIVIVVAGAGYRRTHSALDRSLVIAAVTLVAVQVAYFAYYAAGITAMLWDDGNGFYFSENDVLHVGMILWLIYVAKALNGRLVDIDSVAEVTAS